LLVDSVIIDFFEGAAATSCRLDVRDCQSTTVEAKARPARREWGLGNRGGLEGRLQITKSQVILGAKMKRRDFGAVEWP